MCEGTVEGPGDPVHSVIGSLGVCTRTSLHLKIGSCKREMTGPFFMCEVLDLI